MKAGRRYDKAQVAEEIISRIAAARAVGKPVCTVFTDLSLPAESTFYGWLQHDASLRGRFDQARGKRSTTVHGD
jgi:hypothetical protein